VSAVGESRGAPGPRRWRFRVGWPLLVSLVVHAVIVGVAGVYVVHEHTVAKSRAFEAPVRAEPPAQRQVEHRLQIARRGGGPAPVSPAAVRRILSTAGDALALPAPAELPAAGASLFGGGFGGSGSGVGLGPGGGTATSLGAGGLGGRGFVSLTFLGLTQPKVRKVVFVVDVSRDLMDIRKGGFKAFGIIRDEMQRLVGQLPPSAEFGVVLFGGAAGDINRHSPALLPATLANKEAFFAWLKPLNATPDRLGTHSAGGFLAWRPRPLSGAGLDETLMLPNWVRATQAALEMKPEVIFMVTGSGATGMRKRTAERLETLNRRNDLEKERLRRKGIDPDGIAEARNRALAKARSQLNDINTKLRAEGKAPYIVTDTKRVFQPDFQAELKRAGFAIELDLEGWADAQGRPIWELGVSVNEKVPFAEVLTHITRLQAALLRDKAAVHVFLFVGPEERPVDPLENLTALAKRNGGKFELLTAARLEELARPPSRK
jgi:hypothetical protein